MSQACRSCDRSWDDRAVFCGACGAHLGGDLRPLDHPGTAPDDGAATTARWRWAALAVAMVVGIGLAIPAVQVDRSSPVEGDVGLPDTQDLRPAAAADDANSAPSEQARSRAVPPPNVSCWRDGTAAEVPCVRWIRRVLDPTRSTGRELVVGNRRTVVAVGAGTLRGIDASSGHQRWEQPLDRPVETAAVGDRVGILHQGGQARAVALADGRPLWSADAFTPLYGRTVVDGLAYTADRDEDGPKLVVRSAVDGTVSWEARTDGADLVSVLATTPAGVLASTRDRRLLFLDASTGDPAWQVAPGMQVLDVRAGLLVVAEPPDGGIRDSDPDDAGTTIRALELPGGEVRWTRTVAARNVPFGVQGELVLAPSASQLTAIDVTTGQLRWTIAASELEHAAGRAAAADTAVPGGAALTFGSSSGTLRARDPQSGALRWEHTSTTQLRGAFLVEDDLLLVPSRRGLTALDPVTGRELLRVHADGALYPVGAGTELLVDHRSGYAVGFDFPEGSTLREAS